MDFQVGLKELIVICQNRIIRNL